MNDLYTTVFKKGFLISLLTFIMLLFTGCEVFEGIFKLGFWAAILLVVIIVAIIIFIVIKVKKKKKG